MGFFFFFFLAQHGSAKIRVGHPELFGRMRLNRLRSGSVFSLRVKSAIWGMETGLLARAVNRGEVGPLPTLLFFIVVASHAAFINAEIHKSIKKSSDGNLDNKSTFQKKTQGNLSISCKNNKRHV